MKLLALVEARDHVCCRYRVRAFEPALADAGWSLTVEGLASNPIARWAQCRRASRYDVVLLQRKLLPGWQLGELRRRARRLIFDFDDAILFRDSYDPRGPRCRRRAARFSRTVRLADAVFAGNDFLADCALSAGARGDRVRVIPTCIEPERYPLATPKPAGTAPQLVWIGSSSTLQGLERQGPLWERLGREIPRLRLRVIGDRFPQFESLDVIAVHWSEATEADEIAAGDIGMSWIPDDLWSRGKCGLKVLQYQAAGLPVVANPVGVHRQMITHGATGFLADSADDWVAAIRSLAANAPLRERMGRAARASVEANYSVSAWSDLFVAALDGPPATLMPRPVSWGLLSPGGRTIRMTGSGSAERG